MPENIIYTNPLILTKIKRKEQNNIWWKNIKTGCLLHLSNIKIIKYNNSKRKSMHAKIIYRVENELDGWANPTAMVVETQLRAWLLRKLCL